MPLADDRVEHAVPAEQDAPAVVVRARARRAREDRPEVRAPSVAILVAQNLIPQLAVHRPRRIHVHERTVGVSRMQRDAEHPALAFAVHTTHRLEQPVVGRREVDHADLARVLLDVPELPVGSEREGNRLLQAAGDLFGSDVGSCGHHSQHRADDETSRERQRSAHTRSRGVRRPMTNPIFGRVVRRVEDPRFLTGRGRYVETVRPKGALRAVIVRSIIAHGRLEGVDVDAVSSMPGVVAVLTAADLSLPDRPPADDVEGPFDRPVPASGTVRYVGEPVALVLAETLGQASDAADSVVAHVEPLDVVVGVDAALADGASMLFAEAGTNIAYAFESGWEENVLDGSDVVVRVRVEHQRLAPLPNGAKQ